MRKRAVFVSGDAERWGDTEEGSAGPLRWLWAVSVRWKTERQLRRIRGMILRPGERERSRTDASKSVIEKGPLPPGAVRWL